MSPRAPLLTVSTGPLAAMQSHLSSSQCLPCVKIRGKMRSSFILWWQGVVQAPGVPSSFFPLLLPCAGSKRGPAVTISEKPGGEQVTEVSKWGLSDKQLPQCFGNPSFSVYRSHLNNNKPPDKQTNKLFSLTLSSPCKGAWLTLETTGVGSVGSWGPAHCCLKTSSEQHFPRNSNMLRKQTRLLQVRPSL